MRNLSLDGLRAVAITLVLANHHYYLGSGWIGVDLFFVLSGYLITNILRHSRGDRFYWQEFWIKRVTRIAPGAVLLLVVAVFVGLPLSKGVIVAYLLSFGDVLMLHKPVVLPVALFWSLAIEEHFYLVWPFAVRVLPARSLVRLLVALIVAEPVLRAVASQFHPDWEVYYFLTPFRLDGLAFGSLLAIALEDAAAERFLRRWSPAGIACAVLLFGAFKFALGNGYTRAAGGAAYNATVYSILDAGCAAVIAFVVTRPMSPFARLLAWRPLVFIGTISYGLYLFHVLVRDLVMSRFLLSYRASLLVDLPITVAVAWLSFRFYEQPILSMGRRFSASLRDRDRTMVAQSGFSRAS